MLTSELVEPTVAWRAAFAMVKWMTQKALTIRSSTLVVYASDAVALRAHSEPLHFPFHDVATTELYPAKTAAAS